MWRTSVTENTEYTPQTTAANACHSDWQAELLAPDGSQFNIYFADDKSEGATVDWSMSGIHNVNNALVAVAAAYNVGIDITTACAALSAFAGIKRRMELIGEVNDILVFDDFAHHPTAITTTLDGAKKKLTDRRIWAIIEPRSNTMKMGIHQDSLAASAALADHTLWYEPAGLEWGLQEVIERATILNTNNQEMSSLATNSAAAPVLNPQHVMPSVDAIIEHLKVHAQSGDAIVIMSNGGFEGIHQRLLTALAPVAI